MKNSKITYNPKGLKRKDNAVLKSQIPKKDLKSDNIVIKSFGVKHIKIVIKK